MTNFSHAHIAYIELHMVRPTKLDLIRIAHALNVTVAKIAGGKEEVLYLQHITNR